jgi:hypothetical protein
MEVLIMKKILIAFLGITFLLACNKDKFKTEPQVKIKSLSPDDVYKGQAFRFNAEVTDKEGDLQDSVFLVSKRFNGATLLTTDTIPFSIQSLDFPDRTKIEVSAIFSYGEFVPGTIFQNLEGSDRQLAVGIIVRDKAGNRSQYVESDKITLRKL